MAPAWQHKVMSYFRSPRKPRSSGSAGNSGCHKCKKAKRSLETAEVNTEPIVKQVARYDEDTATENIREEECADFVKVRARAKTRVLLKANGARPSPIVRQPLQQSTNASFRCRKRPLTKLQPPKTRAKSVPTKSPRKARTYGGVTGGGDSGGEDEYGDWRCSVFVSHIPIASTKEEIGGIFGRFGKVDKVVIPGKQFRQQHASYSYAAALTDPSAYAFIYFARPSAVEAAVAAPPIETGPGNFLHVERRRDPRSRRSPSGSPPSRSDSNGLQCDISYDGIIGASTRARCDWKFLLTHFNWRHAAARYTFRTMSMEDYLNVYVHALASYRGVNEEDVEGLMKKLIALSESCPDDIGEIMPPSISGLVYNQFQAESRKNGEEKHFDLASILRRSGDIILFSDPADGKSKVRYRNRLSRDEATLKLRIILIEGLFIYFFAKFCHGPVFDLMLPFYEKFEPIRSVLLTVTECPNDNVSEALDCFFLVFSDILVVSEDKTELRLSVDYFNRDHRRDMRPFLFNQPLFFDEPEVYPDDALCTVNQEHQQSSLLFDKPEIHHCPIQIPPILGQLPSPMSPAEMSPPSFSGYSSRPWSPFSPLPWGSNNMLEDLLAPASVAADGLTAMPKNVTSVVGNVLDETVDDVAEDVDYFGNSYKLLSNTAVVDEVAGKFGVPEEERAQLKLDLEEQTRSALATLIEKCRSMQCSP